MAAIAVIAAGLAGSRSAGGPSDTALVSGLDHVVLAVRDLDRAAAAWRRLGFALKPGRPHANGIRNWHVKFPDGTEIELLTVNGARDELTARYEAHLAAGDGPAFVCLHASDLDALARWFAGEERPVRRGSGTLSFPAGDPLRHVFFGGLNRSPTDRPAHFAHANGAEALIGVWIASDAGGAEERLLTRLGARVGVERVHAPGPGTARVARFARDEILLLPPGRRIAGRPIVGATVRTRSVDSVRRRLERGSGTAPPVVRTRRGRSVFVPPGATRGIWLEFREE